jgi:hypothetical protein
VNKVEFLQAELKSHIDHFKDESTRHKLLNRRLKYLLFALTGCATILSSAALRFGDADHRAALNLGIVLVTVGASIVSSIEALRKPADLWIHERSLYYALNDLKRKLEYDMSGETEIRVDEYFKELQSLLASSREKWAEKVKPYSKDK